MVCGGQMLLLYYIVPQKPFHFQNDWLKGQSAVRVDVCEAKYQILIKFPNALLISYTLNFHQGSDVYNYFLLGSLIISFLYKQCLFVQRI